MKNRLVIYAIVLLGVFLAGFVPQYLKSNRLSQEVEALTRQKQVGAARNLISLAFLEVSNNNFGVAGQHASAFFNQVRALADSAADTEMRDVLQKIAARRDVVTAGLAKADPGVRAQVQDILTQMHRIDSPH